MLTWNFASAAITLLKDESLETGSFEIILLTIINENQKTKNIPFPKMLRRFVSAIDGIGINLSRCYSTKSSQ